MEGMLLLVMSKEVRLQLTLQQREGKGCNCVQPCLLEMGARGVNLMPCSSAMAWHAPAPSSCPRRYLHQSVNATKRERCQLLFVM